jgi:hypothetical protein|tara:strand:- start:322 stop:429 length:108 start_codon:yes stop_codon:yes gene_type:complete
MIDTDQKEEKSKQNTTRNTTTMLQIEKEQTIELTM